MNIEIWDVFHDGEIKMIAGNVPGDLELVIEIEYLRKMFSQDGENIILTLKGCDFFQYQNYDMVSVNKKSSSADDFLKENPIILSVETIIDDGIVKINYTNGYFFFRYVDFSLKLDNGTAITCEELHSACKKYWDEWEKKAREARKNND